MNFECAIGNNKLTYKLCTRYAHNGLEIAVAVTYFFIILGVNKAANVMHGIC